MLRHITPLSIMRWQSQMVSDIVMSETERPVASLIVDELPPAPLPETKPEFGVPANEVERKTMKKNRFQIIFPLISACLITGVASAQPKVNSVLNNYSYTLPGLPNYGIAQGSLFDVFGVGIGPAQIPTLPDLSKTALTTNLNGVTVNITVSGTTVQAPLYYVSAGQIAAILPSNTPVGTGTITVTYNSQTSATSPITVVPAAFGLRTVRCISFRA